MNQQELLSKKKPVFSVLDWVKNNFFIVILLLTASLWLLFSWLGQDKRKFFRLVQEENTNKILITGLEAKDYQNIDWDKNPEYTLHPTAGQYEYVFFGKNERWWEKIRPTHYYTITEVKPEGIEKAIEANEKGEKKLVIDWDKKERPIKLTIPRHNHSLLPKQKTSSSSIIEKVLTVLIVLLIIQLLFGKLFRGSFSFPNLQSQKIEIASPSIKFKDIGGLHEAKEELQEIIDYFHNPQIFWKQGAQIPKGILLVGPPGNGKTLLAKALAGECKLPFIYRSAPEFEKGIIGWGAADVRNTFAQARKYASEKGGCLIFVDEIDAIAGKRHQSVHSHHETLNQLLNELDGFSSRENVIFLAATNSLNVLDPALLRPGRFDRHILISLPNYQARQEIIALCLKKRIVEKDVNQEELADMTQGLSGAEIVNIFREAVILSIRYGKKAIDQEIIFEAHDRNLMGPALRSYTFSTQRKLLVAYHEAGHALTSLAFPKVVEVKKITIVPRWEFGGYTWISFRNQKDDYLINKEQILVRITGLLGGRASEEVVYGSQYVTVGAYSDFKRVSNLVRDLILRHGMSDLGFIFIQDSPFFGEENLQDLSEASRQKVEKESEKILQECYQKARKILQEKRKVLDLLAQALVEKNTLQKEEIYYIFANESLPRSKYLPVRLN